MGKTLNTKKSDKQLVQEIILTQRQDYIEDLYERYVDKIYRRSISFVKESAIAEDLTHDIFMKVLLNLGSFKGKSKFSTWIYSITYNFCIDYLRKKQKERLKVHNYGKVGSNYHEEDDIESFESLRQIKVERLVELMEKISIEDKMILLMKYQDNLSIKQIQSVFNISESAVKMRINRAKAKIKRLYKSEYKESYK